MNKEFSTYEVDLLSVSRYGDSSVRDALIFLGLALPHNENDVYKEAIYFYF